DGCGGFLSVQDQFVRSAPAGHRRCGRPDADRRGRRGPRAAQDRRPMIRINLLPVDRERRKKRAALSFGTVMQQVTVACTLILLTAIGVCGWRYYEIWQESSALDKEIMAAQQETQRLHSIIKQVQLFEQRKGQLAHRVGVDG